MQQEFIADGWKFARCNGIVRAHRARGVGLEKEMSQCLDRLPRDPAKKLLGFHAYRRKWATEREHLPLKDVAEAGGWLDTRSLEQCYQQADEATLLQGVSEPRKLRETIAETIAAGAGNE